MAFWFKWEHTQHDGYKTHRVSKQIVEAETIQEAEKKFLVIEERWEKARQERSEKGRNEYNPDQWWLFRDTPHPFFRGKVYGPFKTKEKAKEDE